MLPALFDPDQRDVALTFTNRHFMPLSVCACARPRVLTFRDCSGTYWYIFAYTLIKSLSYFAWGRGEICPTLPGAWEKCPKVPGASDILPHFAWGIRHSAPLCLGPLLWPAPLYLGHKSVPTLPGATHILPHFAWGIRGARRRLPKRCELAPRARCSLLPVLTAKRRCDFLTLGRCAPRAASAA